MLTAALYSEYRQQVWKYARWLTGCEHDADEIVHEAFCRLLGHEQRNPLEDGSAQPAALLFAIVRNHAIDILRRRKKHPQVSIESIGESGNRVARGAADVLELEELKNELRAAVARLPGSWADALFLRVASDMSYEEIARTMGCTRNQVRTWIHRARKQLGSEPGILAAINGHSGRNER